jgi:hypothetical protein
VSARTDRIVTRRGGPACPPGQNELLPVGAALRVRPGYMNDKFKYAPCTSFGINVLALPE